jgi:hypothetical protein
MVTFDTDMPWILRGVRTTLVSSNCTCCQICEQWPVLPSVAHLVSMHCRIQAVYVGSLHVMWVPCRSARAARRQDKAPRVLLLVIMQSKIYLHLSASDDDDNVQETLK